MVEYESNVRMVAGRFGSCRQLGWSDQQVVSQAGLRLPR